MTRATLWLGLALALGILPARAETYPDRTVRIIVPTTPGGGYDLVGRLAAETLRQVLGGTFIVENTPGAGSLVGTRMAVKAQPDGYTILVGGLANMVLNFGMYAQPGYETTRDLTAIGIVASTPYVLVARKDFAPQTMADIVAAARAKPGSITIGTAGPGTGQDVMATLFASLAGIELTKVPYRGSAPVYTDLMSGRVDLFFDPTSSALPQVGAGTVRIVATMADRPNPRFPEAPITKGTAFADLADSYGTWFGLFVPRRTPPDVVATLRAGLAKTVLDPTFRKRVEASGLDILDIPGAKADEVIANETAKWIPLMQLGGIARQ